MCRGPGEPVAHSDEYIFFPQDEVRFRSCAHERLRNAFPGALTVVKAKGNDQDDWELKGLQTLTLKDETGESVALGDAREFPNGYFEPAHPPAYDF